MKKKVRMFSFDKEWFSFQIKISSEFDLYCKSKIHALYIPNILVERIKEQLPSIDLCQHDLPMADW